MSLEVSIRRAWVLGWLLVLPPCSLAAQETLPTSYSAEEIREAFRVGLEMKTHNWTPDGEEVSVSRVESWSPEGVRINTHFVHSSGEILGEEQSFESTWEELRDHALFYSSTATRERATQATAIGELEGWRYEVAGEGDQRMEFFFADSLPGPPIVYAHFEGDTQVFRAEVIERQEEP